MDVWKGAKLLNKKFVCNHFLFSFRKEADFYTDYLFFVKKDKLKNPMIYVRIIGFIFMLNKIFIQLEFVVLGYLLAVLPEH